MTEPRDDNIEALEAIRADPNASAQAKVQAIRLLLEAQKGLKGSAAATAPQVVHVSFDSCPVCGASAVEMANARPCPDRDPAEGIELDPETDMD